MRQTSSTPVTEARLRRALRTVAIAIECHGDVYWPIFEALKAERDAKRSRRAQLAEFRKGLDTQHVTHSQGNVRRVQP